MAALQAVVNAEEAARAAKQQQDDHRKKPRLVCDPLVTTKDIEKLLHAYVSWTGNKDLFSQIHPPPSSPRVVGWGSRPDAAWMEKTAGLMFDYTVLCPNGKVSSVKQQAAIRALEDDGVIKKPEGTSLEKFVDNVDLLIRVLLKMFRSTKLKGDIYKRVMGKVGNKGALKIQAVLDKLQLDKEVTDDDPNESSPVQVYTAPLVSFSPAPSVSSSPVVPSVPRSWQEKNGVEELGFPSARLNSARGDGNTGTDILWGFPSKRLNSSGELAMVVARPLPKKRNLHKPRVQIVPKKEAEDEDEDEARFSEMAANFRSCEADAPLKKRPAAAKSKSTKPTQSTMSTKPTKPTKTAVTAKQPKEVKKDSDVVKAPKITSTVPAPCVV